MGKFGMFQIIIHIVSCTVHVCQCLISFLSCQFFQITFRSYWFIYILVGKKTETDCQTRWGCSVIIKILRQQ